MTATTTSPGRGRPRTGSAQSDAERARRYRARKKLAVADTKPEPKADAITELREQLAAAHDEIRSLREQLARMFVTKNDDSGKWSIQERKGNARWHTVEKGLSRSTAESRLDKLAASVGTSRYSYRMIEDW
ncbi:hypothetical protein J8655_09975 [Dickeya oryzae]|uniref:hypothetical protein n=1 Tax=Dickeya oryzae TaxID=1240404 RepID=UPI001AECC63A|nr:hypothetical protein [Dickeya oryzae]MBP2845805.1 hypothetical protein [Dickeya oryzae]